MKKNDLSNVKKAVKDCRQAMKNIDEAISIYENYDDKYDWLPIPTSMGFVSVRVPKSFILRDLKRQKKETDFAIKLAEDIVKAQENGHQ